MKVWKRFVNKFLFILHLWVKSIQRVSLLWGFNFRGSKYGASISRAQELNAVGLQQIGNLWDPNLNKFCYCEKLEIGFSLKPMNNAYGNICWTVSQRFG